MEPEPVEEAAPEVSAEITAEQKKRDAALAKAADYASQLNTKLAANNSEFHVRAQWNHGKPQYDVMRSVVIEHDVSDERLKELFK